MSTVVVWEPDAADDVDRAWEAASAAEQQAIAKAIEELQHILSTAALQTGESREDLVTRVFTWAPVTVHYRVVGRITLVRVFAAQVYHPQ
jgi:plasmid stabilization system protein ParE